MSEIRFLTLDEVLLIHRDMIDRYGGPPGLRDPGLLESALAMPAAGIEDRYLHADIYVMAAAYLFHINRDHPFVDGNKRVGAASAVVFLYLNGVELSADEDEFEKVVRSVAEGRLDKDQVTEFMQMHSQPINHQP